MLHQRTPPGILAEWHEDLGDQIRAAWLRAEGQLPPAVTSFAGSGSGSGDGSGSGSGDGYGSGSGDGYGYGSGSGSGSGDGYGSGYGSGSGSGSGSGDGSGSGSGSGSGYQPHKEITMPAQGDYVIVRTREQGCMCGEYQWHNGREVCLVKARQIYSWSGKRLTLVDFASVPGECRLSVESAGEVLLLEACGIIPTTPAVEKFLRKNKEAN